MSSSRTRYSMLVTLFLMLLSSASDRLEDRISGGGRESHTGSLDVADDGTGLIVHELNANLGNTTAGACKSQFSPFIAAPNAWLPAESLSVRRTSAAQNAGDLHKFDGLL